MLTHGSLFYTGLEFKDLLNHYRYQYFTSHQRNVSNVTYSGLDRQYPSFDSLFPILCTNRWLYSVKAWVYKLIYCNGRKSSSTSYL